MRRLGPAGGMLGPADGESRLFVGIVDGKVFSADPVSLLVMLVEDFGVLLSIHLLGPLAMKWPALPKTSTVSSMYAAIVEKDLPEDSVLLRSERDGSITRSVTSLMRS